MELPHYTKVGIKLLRSIWLAVTLFTIIALYTSLTAEGVHDVRWYMFTEYAGWFFFSIVLMEGIVTIIERRAKRNYMRIITPVTKLNAYNDK